jgi:multidrug resistance efflux pump
VEKLAMAKNGGKASGFEDELEDKLRQAQDQVRRAQDGVKKAAKRHEGIQREADAFKAGLAKITGAPAPFIAEQMATLERSAKSSAEDQRRAVQASAGADNELAELLLARHQLKEMRG